jgi:hypothetical protein
MKREREIDVPPLRERTKLLKNPDFVGTWTQKARREGLLMVEGKTCDFKMFIAQREKQGGGSGAETIGGVIFDDRGRATFMGTLDNASIYFVKRYPLIAGSDTIYRGTLDGEKMIFVGTFGSSSGEAAGEFSMYAKKKRNKRNFKVPR